MKDRLLLLGVVVATLSIGAFVAQGWRAALFTLLASAVVAVGVPLLVRRR